jgi:putative methionine-R-sulfoxide reductase with GAF domain
VLEKLEKTDKPVFDEQTLAKLLEAAYVVQEHNRKLQALGLRPERLNLRDVKVAAANPPAKPAHSIAATANKEAGSPEGKPAADDYALILAQIVETQHQIQLRHLEAENAMALIAQRVTEIARAGGAAIGILDSGKVRYQAAFGLMTLPVGAEIPAEKALCAACLRTSQITRCEDVDADSLLCPEECRRRGIQSLIAVPVYQVGGIAGSLELYSASKHAFTEQDVHTCQLMAGLVTEALARGEGPTWKSSLASERSAMQEALEKLRPELAALVNAFGSEDSGAEAAVLARAPFASTFFCRNCGHELVGEEQFCGKCGSPRSGDYEPRTMQSKVASLWQMQEAQQKSALTSPPNGSSAEPTAHLGEENKLEEDSEGADIPASQAIVPEAAVSGTWSSAANARAFLEQLTAARSSGALARFWTSRRGDFYLAIAVVMVACAIRWGIWSSHSVSATASPAAAAAAHRRPAPDADLSLFDRALIKLGLAEAPELPEYKGNPQTQVWVDLHTALYYCPGADLYGKTPKGKFTTQRDAQLDQFEPAYRRACD